MSSKSLTTLFILTALATSLSGCGPRFPEAYGIYAREGRDLTEFEMVNDKPVEKWYSFDDDVEIIFYHPSVKEFGARTLFGVTMEEALPLALLTHVRSHVRYEKSRDQSIRITNVQPEGSDVVLKKVAVQYIPVEGNPEILIVSPREPLEKGFYAFGKMRNNPIKFAIGVDDNPDERRKYRGCVDSYFTRKGFTFESDFKPCEALDKENEAWREEAIRALNEGADSGDLDDAYAKAERSLAVNPEDEELKDLFHNTFAEGVRAAIEAEHFKTAKTRANRILELIPNDEEATRLLAEIETLHKAKR